MNEETIQTLIRRDFAFIGPVWRNNVGAMIDAQGRVVRYGLANDSKKLNGEIKSSDLIGITPVMITQDWVGHVIGVFTAIECKSSDWQFSETDDRAVAQRRFIDIVNQHGGFGGFASDPAHINQIIRKR